MPVTGVRPATVRAFMILSVAVALPVSLPPLMHEVSSLQLLTVAPAQQACVCPFAKKPSTPSTPLPAVIVYTPAGHQELTESSEQP